jgi:hypothetical protein
MKQITNPYHDVKEGDEGASKIATIIATEDLALLRAVVPKRGFVQAVINTLIYELAEELRDNDMTYYRPDNEEKICDILSRRSAFGAAGHKDK